ncbi:MAG: transglutaminase domain-containing protein [Ruminococcus sp.]|nr:transglutaminase domain-containing protein [Ruminococcus sp.]
MKKKPSKDFSGIVVCDSITMSVKRKRLNFRRLEAILIAVIGFAAVIMSFLEMFDFNYNRSAAVKAAVICSAVYIAFSLAGKKTFWFVGGSFIVFAAAVYKFIDPIINGFKYVYNVIYCDSRHTEILYYKTLDPDKEFFCITVFFVFCIWLLALVIYTFTIHKANPLIVILATFPIIEIGLYNGINIPIFWGILTIAYWLALFAVNSIDYGEYCGGNGGFVRKGELFFPKRQMRLKVTEKCAFMIILSVAAVTAGTLAVMKLTDYKRSEILNQKRIEVKEAVNSFTFDDLSASISNITEVFGFTFNYESHKLGNVDQVSYKHVTDLVATFDKKYDSAVYLKGYSGAVYGNNEWRSLKDSVYKKADIFDDFKEYAVFPQDFPHVFSQSASPENIDMTVWLEAKRKKNKSYAPYGTNNYGGMEYLNDSTVSTKKDNSSSYSYKFTGVDVLKVNALLKEPADIVLDVNSIANPSERELIQAYCAENGLLSADNSVTVSSALTQDEIGEQSFYSSGLLFMTSLLENDYRSFVYENYLQVPDNKNMEAVSAAFSDVFSQYGDAETAEEKILLLQALRDKVASMAEYSLAPGETPSNRDFVNYFLLENHKGYCIHYATSGVMLARMAGIPARYATGYIVVADDFNDSSLNGDGSYTIKLEDSRSHAWTEIYLDGYGWVPFEFTEGYSSSNIVTTTTAPDNTSQSVTTTAAKPSASQTEKSKTSRTSSSSSTASETTAVTVTTASNAGALNNGSSEAGISSEVKTVLAVSAAVILIALTLFLRRVIIIRNRRKRFTTGKSAERVAYMYAYTEKLLSLLRISRDSMQYTEFSAHVEQQLAPEYFPNGSFAEFVNLALRCSFSSAQPDEDQVRAALEFTELLSRTIYSKSNIFRKISMKIFLVLI